jgi:hypothetical protein
MADINFVIDLVLGVDENTSHRIRKFGFGDGYEQIAPDGINTKVRAYNITTIPFGVADSLAFKNNLDQVCAGDFFLVPAGVGFPPYILGETVRFRVMDNKYTISYIPASDKYRFEFTLKEAFSG